MADKTEIDIDDVRKHWKIATESGRWRSEARSAYDFAAGHQWDQADLDKLADEERPAVTFDRVGVFIDAVSGMEINNRQAIKYLPVEAGDVRPDEVLTNAVSYYERDCGAADEDSEAVRDAIICGIGVTETVLEYETHPEGAPCVKRRDPLQVWFDPRYVTRNLEGMQFVFHGDWMDTTEAEARWPDANLSVETPSGALPNFIPDADLAFQYKDDLGPIGGHEDQVFVLHYQCWWKRDIYRTKDPTSGQIVELDEKQFAAGRKMLKAAGIDAAEGRDYIKTRKKVYYRAFVSGNEILEQTKLPLEQFTFKFITYKRDRNRATWYGMLRAAMDPQRFANKWLSQIMHIVNTNAKGGAYAEANVFADPRKAQEDWAKANSLILMQEGAVSGGKIKERQQAQYPAALDRLMQFAFEALPMVTGINLEVLGLADRQQAGVVETQRRQSAYGILAPLFAAVREYRKSRGQLLLEVVQKLIPEGTLIQIVGQGGQQYVPLVKTQTRYDVIVDQATDSPDFKRKTWEALAQIIPPMMQAGYPVPPEILSFSPLPADVSEQWVSWIKQQGWMPPQMKQQIEQGQKQIQDLGQENQQLKQQLNQAKLDHSVDILDIQRKANESTQRVAAKTYQAELEAANTRAQTLIQAHANATQAQLRAAGLATDARSAAMDRQLQLITTMVKAKAAEQPPQITINQPAQATAPRKARKLAARKTADGSWLIEEAANAQ